MENIVKKDNRKFKRIRAFYENVFSSAKKTILFTGALLFAFLMIFFLCIYFINHSFYNNWSDDILQYYPIMCDFISRIKGGDFSFFNYKNYLGASVFSDTYYVPLDIFTLIIFLLSFLMNTEVAMSIVELFKLVAGTMALCGYLALKKVKPKYIHLIGLLYFSSSGITNFTAFPSFGSLAFYLPFSLIIGYLFLKGKWYYTPLFAMAVVFYNFYLAYTVFAFMGFSILFMTILNREKFHRVIIDTAKYVLFIMLGLLMAMAIFMPSVYYITRSTSRSISSDDSISTMIKMFASYFDLIITFFMSFVNMFVNSFKEGAGLLRNNMVIYDSFIQLRYVKSTMSDLKYLFNPEEFFRILNNTFTPSSPSSFYGYQSSYFIEHISLYVTGVGLTLSSYVFFMKDYKSKVYKWMVVLMVIFMSVPFFSYILSADLSVLYTRWINVLTIPILLMAGHVLSENNLYELKPKYLIVAAIFLAYFACLSSYHHLENLTALAEKNDWSEDLISFENTLFYSFLGLIALLSVLLITLTVCRNIKGKKKKILYPLLITPVVFLMIALSVYVFTIYNNLPEGTFNTSFLSRGPLYSTDDMMLGQYVTLITVMIIFLAVFALSLKKKKLLVILVFIEFSISACYSFGAAAIYRGKATTFNNTHALSDFLSENIGETNIYRVYVDTSIDDLTRTNLARLMPTDVNQNIFHSFINSNTDEIVDILYDIENEGQAGKKSLNTYSYYLNILLGYKYIVASTDSGFMNYSSDIFTLVSENDDYILLEFNNYEAFLSYDNYVERSSYEAIKNSINTTTRYKFVLDYAIIEEEFEEDVLNYVNMVEDVSDYSDDSIRASYAQKDYISSGNRIEPVLMENDLGETVLYYKYRFSGSDAITTKSYALNIYGFSDRSEELIENHQIFVVFDNDEVYYLTSDNLRNVNGSTFHIPIYRSADGTTRTIKYLYIASSTDSATTSPRLAYAIEAIFPAISDISAYEAGEAISSSGLSAYIKYRINSNKTSGLFNVSFTLSSLSIDEMIVEYEDGTFESNPTEFTISKPVLNIYIKKNSSILNLSTPPTISVIYCSIDSAYSDNLINKVVTTKNSTITISYTDTSIKEGYRIIMIPTAYSSDWQVVEGEAKIISVNGGFIGLVVSSNVSENSITIKFVPDGLKDGLILSLLGIITYIDLCFLSFTKRFEKKKKEEIKCQL
ncbi:MAG: YfhO family protein [Bacillales bacterium]|nr:YfhO family protein [Bacillales bacterium]